jgi:TldD protein
MDRADREALCERAIDAALGDGARYVEARYVRRTRESLAYRAGSLELSNVYRDVGLGIRALYDHGWGYSGTNVLTPGTVERAARAAVDCARATALSAGHEVAIPDRASGTYATPLDRDPFEVPLAEKTEIFAEANARMDEVGGVTTTRAGFTAHRQESTFCASNGSRQDQSVTLCGGLVVAIAQAGGDVQIRSSRKSFEGNTLQGGFETLQAQDLVGDATRVAREAVALTTADPTPEGETTIILDGSQLSLQIHESVGHPIELDRVLGEEISLAGASFVLPDKLSGFQYGSPIVNLTADATTPLGPGTFGFDDEGTPATATPIIRDGKFCGYLSGRDEAARIGRPSASSLRAESWSRLPIVRMVNVNLEPGSGSRDDLIGGVEDGLLLDVNKSWSIDDLRLNFQFSCEIAYEIKNGQPTGRIFKNPIYYGVTPRFWGNCSAIAGPEAWEMWGWFYCGKGDPGQIMFVGHGCAPARFDNIRVGST